MKFSSSLFQKGLIIVLVPMVFQIIFVVFFLGKFRELQNLIEQKSRTRELFILTHQLVLDSESKFALSSVSRHDIADLIKDVYRSPSFHKLKSIVSDDTEQSRALADIESSSSEFLNDFVRGTGEARITHHTPKPKRTPNKTAARAMVIEAKGLLDSQRYEDCIKHCHQATKLDPNQFLSYHFCAKAYVKLDAPEKALAEYNNCIEFNGDNEYGQLAVAKRQVLCELSGMSPPENSSAESAAANSPSRGLSSIIFKIQNNLDSVCDIEESKSLLIEKRIEKLQEEITILFWSAFPLTLLLCLGTAYVYAKKVKSPLLHLSQNSERFFTDKPLTTLRTSDKVFASLDALLHQTHQSLTDAVTRERKLIDNSAGLICTLDNQCIFQRANLYSNNLLSTTPETLVGESLSTYVAQDERMLASDKFDECRQQNTSQTFEIQIDNPKKIENESIYSRWSVFWSELENSYFCVVYDISEEKKVQKLKQDFTDMVSHDLRSPLMALSNASELILHGVMGEVEEYVTKEVTLMGSSINRLMSFINDLLDFQKLKSGKLSLTYADSNLVEIIDEAVDLIASSAEAKSIKFVKPSGEINAVCDSARLSQVLVNFIGNAIKFSPQGGSIIIEVLKDSQSVEIVVNDSGPGVPPELAEKIFEAFEQVPGRESKGGTGLGLAICKLIAESHGGTVGVRNATPSTMKTSEAEDQSANTGSASNTGSAFWIRLPKISLQEQI